MTTQPRRRDPVLRWEPGDQLGDILISWLFATMPANLTVGDGTPRQAIGAGQTLPHRYDKTGAYRIRARQTGGTQPVLAEAQVIIRDHKPAVTLSISDSDPTMVVATAPATLDTTKIIPEYRVHWDYQNDPARFTDFWGMPNAHTHTTMPPGVYTGRVVDLGTRWWVPVHYTVPGYNPDATFAYRTPEQDPPGWTVDLTLTRVDTGRPIRIYWVSGDAQHWQTIDSPSVGLVVPHTYRPEDPWNGGTVITLAYDTGDEGHGRVRFVDLPRPS